MRHSVAHARSKKKSKYILLIEILRVPYISSFDLDLPVECDDEYFTHPDPQQAFKQPSGKPSIMSHFICLIKLDQILAFALRTIVSMHSIEETPYFSLFFPYSVFT